MPLPHVLTGALLQAAAAIRDTIVTRTIPQRDLFDWTSGTLQIIVLILGIGLLVTLILLLLSLRSAVQKVNSSLEKLTAETGPLIKRATGIVDDAREVVAMVRTDVERITDAASRISEQLIDAAETTSQRIDDVNAVIDVLQTELESTAIGTVAAVRGVRVGARALSDNLSSRTRRDRRAGDLPPDAADFVDEFAEEEFAEDFDDDDADDDFELGDLDRLDDEGDVGTRVRGDGVKPA